MHLDLLIGRERPLAWVLRFWPVLAAAFASSLVATALCKRVALCFDIVDKSDNLVKTHAEPVPYLGGVGIFVGLAVGVFAGLYRLRADTAFPQEIRWLVGILTGSAMACLVGLADDLLDLRPRHKMLG